MKPTDYEMVKLAFDSVDLVILRSLVQQATKRRSYAECQRLDLLTRARDLLAEFYLVQGNGHGCELGKSYIWQNRSHYRMNMGHQRNFMKPKLNVQ